MAHAATARSGSAGGAKRRGLAPFVLAGLAAAAFAAAADENSTRLDVQGMTFVASRGDVNEIVLRAEKAHFDIDSEVAELHSVQATVAPTSERVGFEMTCERGELDLDTSDFYAEGNVEGRTENGRKFNTEWVRYQHDRAVLFTDSPVTITERGGGTYQGGGFRYDVAKRSFRLIGGASVTQTQ